MTSCQTSPAGTMSRPRSTSSAGLSTGLTDPRTRPVGEVEFANGVAAMGASGQFGAARICASIVGHVNLLGPGVKSVLDCMVGARTAG